MKTWRVPDVSKQKALKVAVSCLYKQCVEEEGIKAIQEAPRPASNAEGSWKESILRRLLVDEITMVEVAADDITGATSDLQLLSLLQLLAIKTRIGDSVAVSATRGARASFTAALDDLLLEKIARRGLERGGVPLFGDRRRQEVLRGLGTHMMLVLGIASVLASESQPPATRRLPSVWAFRLNPEAWGEGTLALLRTDATKIDLICRDRLVFDCLGSGELVAAITDKVVALDPRHGDIFAELLDCDQQACVLDKIALSDGIYDTPRRMKPKGSVLERVRGFETMASRKQGSDPNSAGDGFIWVKRGPRWYKMRQTNKPGSPLEMWDDDGTSYTWAEVSSQASTAERDHANSMPPTPSTPHREDLQKLVDDLHQQREDKSRLKEPGADATPTTQDLQKLVDDFNQQKEDKPGLKESDAGWCVGGRSSNFGLFLKNFAPCGPRN